MAGQVLHYYQNGGLAKAISAWRKGARSLLLVLPTGGGKTTCFAELIRQLTLSGQKSLILVHRRELATQASNRLREFGVDFGFIMAGVQPRPMAPVQIASVQTLVRRPVPHAALVVCDEAHLSTAGTWQKILSQYPNARILGCTATPWRLSGKPLIGAYDASIVVSTPRELCERGFLSPYVGFSYKTPDLSKVHTVGGEYNERESAAAMSQNLIVDSIVEEHGKHARHLSTVVFAVTVDHSRQLTERFKAAGVAAEHLDGQTSTTEREAILARVASGKTMVLCNVGVAVEGLDIPRLKCCILARPTKSLARAIQMMGRVRRPWNGVTARIHDHAFVIGGPGGHGLPDDDRDYTLHAAPPKKPTEANALRQCAECFAYFRGPRCSFCATEAPIGERKLNTVADAEKIEFSSAQSAPQKVTRAPVEVSWTDIGKAIEGVFDRTWEEATQYGTQRFYFVRGDRRDYTFPGTTRLNALMAEVLPEQRIRVTYTGKTDLGGGKVRKEFKLEVDDASDRSDSQSEAIKRYLNGMESSRVH